MYAAAKGVASYLDYRQSLSPRDLIKDRRVKAIQMSHIHGLYYEVHHIEVDVKLKLTSLMPFSIFGSMQSASIPRSSHLINALRLRNLAQ